MGHGNTWPHLKTEVTFDKHIRTHKEPIAPSPWRGQGLGLANELEPRLVLVGDLQLITTRRRLSSWS
eukprot:3951631-Pyramimonas_sp.AAC.1